MKEKNGRNCGLKWVEATVVQLLIIITINSLLAVTISGQHVAAERSRENVYKANIPLPADGEREISIRIGTNDDGTGQISVNDEGDEGDDDPAGSQSESTTSDQCSPGSNCCYQYTWPGHLDTIPETENATCEYYKKVRKDESIACFDPMVFTVARPDEDVRGTPPNFTDLETAARTNNWNVYCVMGSKSCVTFTYYSNADKKMENQTKFCGIVTDTDGNRIQNGCHRQNVDGSWREVCVCKNSLCNEAQSLKLTWPVILITLSCIFGLSNHFKL